MGEKQLSRPNRGPWRVPYCSSRSRPHTYGTIPPTDGSGRLHLALSISAGQVKEWIAWLGDHGLTVESRITWPTGGESLYFRDPDEHLIELKTANWHGTEFRW